MKRATTFPSLSAIIAMIVAFASPAHAQITSVLQFDTLVRNYNIVTFDDANLTLINNDTEGPLAIGGNLTVGGVPLVNLSQFESSADPTLYVKGSFNVTSNFAHLNSGYASLPGNAGVGTWSPANKRYQTPAGGTLDSTNASHLLSANDPRTNPAPANWDFTTLRAQMNTISNTLRTSAATGTIAVNPGNQTLTFSGASTGVTVFNLDASLLNGNQYLGQNFSNIGLNIGSEAVYVINLLNAGGRTIFGGGINFNAPGNNGAQRLLWNIVAGPGEETAVALGNGGRFYGSVLAPGIDLANALNSPLDGQILSESLIYTNAEAHYIAFTPPTSFAAIPEPATSAALAGAVAFAIAAFRRRRTA